MSKLFRNSISILMIVGVAAVSLSAQAVRPPLPRASQKSTVTQTVGTTEISVTYSRPSVKGRTIWGDPPAGTPAGEATLDDGRSFPKGTPIVFYGKIWRSGANEATMFSVTDDVLINGQPLPAGKYSFHTIPSKDGEWTIIFNKELDWGSFTYKASQDALRVKTKATTEAESQELLTYGFDNVAENSANVVLRWEKIAVPFKVEVKDVVGSTMNRLRSYVAEGKADDWQRPLNAGMYAKNNKLTDDANKWFDQSVKAVEMQIASKPTFANYRSKATILINSGRTPEGIVAAEKAVEVGKAEKADAAQIAALEKRIADLKAAK
jgi:hypothetical protein